MIRNIPILKIDSMFNKDYCKGLPLCQRFRDEMYFKNGKPNRYYSRNVPKEKQIAAGIIRLSDYNNNYDKYKSEMKKIYKGAVIRNIKKAESYGFYCHICNRLLYIPDIHEINHSMEFRQKNKMKPGYLRSIEEMGGAPIGDMKNYLPKAPDCPYHWSIFWGCFIWINGYKQGEIVTNQKMVGYINSVRRGDTVLHSMILGHGEYLKYNIMFLLHFSIIKWLLTKDKYTEGIKNLMYAGYFQGKETLQRWKKKTGFKPYYLCYE